MVAPPQGQYGFAIAAQVATLPAAGRKGFLYLLTTTNAVYYDTGTALVLLSPGATGPVSSLQGLGGAITLTTPNSSLSISTSGQNVTLDINLGNVNIWTARQTFSNLPNAIRFVNGFNININPDPQSVGDTNLDIPDFAGVNDQFVFKNVTQTLASKTLTSPTMSGTIAGTYTIGGTPTLGATLALGGQTLSGTATASGTWTFSAAGTAVSITNNATISGTATIGTLSATTINGAALSGTFSGAVTFSGALTLTASPLNFTAGAQFILGTTDNNAIMFKTNAVNVLQIATSGNLNFQQASSITTTAGALTLAPVSGSNLAFTVAGAGNIAFTLGTGTVTGVTIGTGWTFNGQTIAGTATFSGAITLSATAAFTNTSPFSVANGQTLTVSVTAQTVGAATLTIPNFASVSDTFVFITLTQTLSNKTIASPTLSGTAAGTYTLGGTPTLGSSLALSGDNTISIATATNRLATISSIQFNVFGASADANPTVQLSSGALKFGAGGATALSFAVGISLGGSGGTGTNLFAVEATKTGVASGIEILASTISPPTGIVTQHTLYSTNDSGNASYIRLFVNTSSSLVIFDSNSIGTGSTLPFVFRVGGTEAFRITTTPVLQASVALSWIAASTPAVGVAGIGASANAGNLLLNAPTAQTINLTINGVTQVQLGAAVLDLTPNSTKIKFNAGTTGAGSAALGANSPAVTNTAPFTWLQATASDGSAVFIPAWK